MHRQLVQICCRCIRTARRAVRGVRRVRLELTDRFGGVTAYSRVPATGLVEETRR